MPVKRSGRTLPDPATATTTTVDTAESSGSDGIGLLRLALQSAGGSMSALTVLAPQNDPFRVDTPAGHRDGRWLADQVAELDLTGPRHLRGLHYVLIGRRKPNGLPYTNTEQDWLWLANAAKSARWLGYVPFEQIVDQRNAPPEIRKFTPPDPQPYISVDFEIVVPDYEDLRPYVGVAGFTGTQPYRLALVGEKSSLRDVLASVADRYQADLYLPTGEPSDTMLHAMAASADDRPLIVFYFSDCDPSGWQMPVSVARKLQALKVLSFPQLDFQVHRVGLTPDQVRLYGLPSTPLKDTEKRADRWQEATGVQQTEIDSLAALQPDLLRQIAGEAIGPFFDDTLTERVVEARRRWIAEAQQILDAQTGVADLEQLRADAADRLAEKRDEIAEILDTVRLDGAEFDLPTPQIPGAVIDPFAPHPLPLCDSADDFTEQCRRLKASKQYDAAEIGGV